jgi:guanylate cyclase
MLTIKIETKADGSYMVVAGLENDVPKETRRESVLSIEVIIYFINFFIHSTLKKNFFKSSQSSNTFDSLVSKVKFPYYNQAELIAHLALELIEKGKNIKNPFQTGEKIQIKIGFNTGKIVAGIVGLHTIQFCLFGDTVNTASRMSSNSLVNIKIKKIN